MEWPAGLKLHLDKLEGQYVTEGEATQSACLMHTGSQFRVQFSLLTSCS